MADTPPLNRLLPWIPRLLLTICLGLAVSLSLLRGFDPDEFEAVHSSWKIISGQHIYIDFYQHHHPLLYYILTPIIWLFGETTTTLLAARAFIYLFVLGIFWATYQLCKEVFSQEYALTAILLLGFNILFLNKAIEVRPDVPQTLFGVLAVWSLFRHLRTEQWRWLFASAFSLGIAFLFLQKAVFLIAILALILAARRFVSHISSSQLVAYGVTFLFTWSIYLIYLANTQGLEMYFLQNFQINASKHGSKGFPTVRLLSNINNYSTVTVLFAALSLLFTKSREQIEFTVLAFVLLLLAASYRVQWEQYYLQSMPYVSIIAAFGLHKVFQSRKLPIVICLLIASAVPVTHHLSAIRSPYQEQQFSRINYVLRKTTENDYVYDSARQFNLYRKDLHFFWFGTFRNNQIDKFRQYKPIDYDTYALIEKLKPRIISRTAIPDITDRRITEHYERIKEHPNLYLRTDS